MSEQIESELFIVQDLPCLYHDGEQQQCVRWTNGNWFTLDIWYD